MEELAWALGVCLVSGWMLRWSIRRLRLALECHTWPQVPGLVLQSNHAYTTATVREIGGRYLGAMIIYQYRVCGRLYTGCDVRFTAFYVWGHLRAMRRYPPGAEVSVLHHPRNPRKAVLESGATVDGWVEVVGYGVLFLLGIAWVVHQISQLAGVIPT